MAKINHNNYLDTIDAMMTNARNQGVLHLYAEGDHFDGRKIQVNGKKLLHFGTTGYLGLEQDERLKQAGVAAILKYGTQFPLSKSYISHPLYEQLEAKLTAMYGHPIIVTKNSTLGHLAVIPSMVADSDGVILDHQVHWSVQNAVHPLKLRSVPVEMIRHSDLNMLEEKIVKLRDRCQRIWYMADGVYSMYGDYAPIDQLMALSKKYPQLHLYFDDVHGMSWKGKHGTGYVMDILGDLPKQVVLVGTLSKTFGASGSVVVCPDQRLHRKIINFGGPLTFSAQLEPASVAAASASADIHLSPEIYHLQEELYDRIELFNELLSKTELPLIEQNSTPVFYIGTGMPVTGYNLVRRLLKQGIYTNLGVFPAVPVKNTGLRITISRHNTKEDITQLAQILDQEYFKSLTDTKTDLARVNFAFGRNFKKIHKKKCNPDQFSITVKKSIKEISPTLWDSTIGREGIMDWKGMQFLEEVFSKQGRPEHHYDFYYFEILDQSGQPLLLSFFTYGLWKKDMLAPASVSLLLEKKRKEQPYLHTGKIFCMGSFLTEGNHLFINRKNNQWRVGLDILLLEVEKLEKELNPESILLRDFDPDDRDLKDYFLNKGFIKVSMPESSKYVDFTWNTLSGYQERLSSRSRRHLRKEVLPFRKEVNLEILEEASPNLLRSFYKLYLEVKENNPALNTFNYPFRLFEAMSMSPNWEFLCLRLKTNNILLGVMFCYKSSTRNFVPLLVGMDYQYAREYQVYRQLLFQTVMRAKDLKCEQIDFGLTAAFEKRKIGAKVLSRCAYFQAKDNFALEALEWLRKD